MVRGLFERELCRDKNKNTALATPHRKKTCASSHIFVSLRMYVCPCEFVRYMCVRSGGGGESEREVCVFINRDIVDTYIVFYFVNRVWCFTLALSSGCHAKNTSVRQNTKNHNQCLPLSFAFFLLWYSSSKKTRETGGKNVFWTNFKRKTTATKSSRLKLRWKIKIKSNNERKLINIPPVYSLALFTYPIDIRNTFRRMYRLDFERRREYKRDKNNF